MAEEAKKKILRIVLSGIIGLLLVATVVLWVLNYRTLETATSMADKTAESSGKNFRYYMSEYHVVATKLEQVTLELEAANAELSNTRSELSSVQQMNDALKTDIQGLERYKSRATAKGEALEAMIVSFKKKNKDLDVQLQGVRKELAVFQPDISDLNEGRSKVSLFKDHIRKVKLNMRTIKRQAAEIRGEAQKERDRLESLYGNGGFMVKDGQNKAVTAFDAKKVEIQVKFVNP